MISATGILEGSFHSSPREQMTMSMRSSVLPICERRTVFRLFISEKPRSQMEVSTAKERTMEVSTAKERMIRRITKHAVHCLAQLVAVRKWPHSWPQSWRRCHR